MLLLDKYCVQIPIDGNYIFTSFEEPWKRKIYSRNKTKFTQKL